MNKKIRAKHVIVTAAAFAAMLITAISVNKADVFASEAAFYMESTSGQTSETVKKVTVEEVSIPEGSGPVEEAKDAGNANGETGETGETEEVAEVNENTTSSEQTQTQTQNQTVTPTAVPTATPTVAPTPRPTATPTAVPTPAHTHSYVSAVTKAATCTTNGTLTYTCSCGASYTESIPATGHAYSQTGYVAATCTTNGSITYTCSNCGGTKSETLLATGHTWVPVTQDVYIVDQAAWDEEVTTYQQVVHTICSTCGLDFTAAGYSTDDLLAHSEAHALALEGGGWETAVIQIPVTTYVHHDEIGHVETQTLGYVCSVCGAAQ